MKHILSRFALVAALIAGFAGSALAQVTGACPTGQFVNVVGDNIVASACSLPKASSYSVHPANPTGTTSTTGLLMGLAGTISPTATNRVLLIINGDVTNGTSNDGATVQCAFGTGTAPSNGGAITPSVKPIGAPVKFVNAASTTEKVPFSCQGALVNLTLGTTYWLDLIVAAITGGTATVADITITAIEF